MAARWSHGPALAGAPDRRTVSGSRHATSAAISARMAPPLQARMKPPAVEEPMPEQRAERDAEVQRERVEAEGLACPTGRSQVGDGGECRDEEERLGDAEQEPQARRAP